MMTESTSISAKGLLSFHALRSLRLLLLLPLLAGHVYAQTGLNPDPDGLDSLPEWKPEPMGIGEHFVVDLRNNMPKPGFQTMNDCLAWASAYAVKSYHESIDQGWKPDRKERIFSPRFVYNQINGGKNKGTNILSAFKLLRTKGAATLATCDYRAGDYRSKPTADAMREAQFFKVSGIYVVKNGPKMRTALAQGHPVIICVKTNPIFSSGRYKVYTTALHDKGKTKRTEDQAHGFHAMVAVGYDDSKKAFLVQNSWGTRWGDGGYAWISYDVAEKFEPMKTGDSLIYAGVVMLDERRQAPSTLQARLAKTTDPTKVTVIDKAAIRAAGNGSYRSYDSKTKRHRYFYSAWLNGTQTQLKHVKKVVWTGPGRTGVPETITSTWRTNGFRISGYANTNIFSVPFEIHFTDGTSRKSRLNYKLRPVTEKRELKLVQFLDEYYETRMTNGRMTDWWYWHVRVEGSLNDLADIESVTFKLPNTYINPTRTIRARFASSTHGFYTGGPTSRPHKVTAEVKFNDGRTQELTCFLRLRDPVKKDYSITSSWVEDGVNSSGETVYAYTLDLNGGRKALRDVSRVRWWVRDNRGKRAIESWGKGWPAKDSFQASGTAVREFRVEAEITMRDKSVRRLTKWITLGPDGRYPDPRRVELRVYDRYWGENSDGEPSWIATAWLNGDPESIKKVRKVVYTSPTTGNTLTSTYETSRDFSYAFVVTKDCVINAKIHFKDGHISPAQLRVQLQSKEFELQPWHQAWKVRKGKDGKQVWGWRVGLEAPERDMRFVRKVTYKLPAPYEPRMVTINDRYAAELRTFGMRQEGPMPSRVSMYVHSLDQTVELLTRSITPYNGFIQHSTAKRLRVIERYQGIIKGKPSWRARLRVAGDVSDVTKVEFKGWLDDGRTITTSDTIAPFRGNWIELTSPTSITAKVHTKAGNIHTLYGRAPLIAERIDSLRLNQRSRLYRNHGQTDYRGWEVWVEGPDNLHKLIKKVEYKMSPELGGKRVVVSKERSANHQSWSTDGTSIQQGTVSAKITLTNGQTREVEIDTALQPKELKVEIGPVVYWGRINNQPYWRARIHLTGDRGLLSRVTKVSYYGKINGTSRSTPDFTTYALVSEKTRQEGVSVSYAWVSTDDGRSLKLPAAHAEVSPTVEDTVRLKRSLWPRGVPHAKNIRPYMVHVVGPEKDLIEVERVMYTIRADKAVPGSKSRFKTIYDRPGRFRNGWEIDTGTANEVPIRATLIRRDGKRVTLNLE